MFFNEFCCDRVNFAAASSSSALLVDDDVFDYMLIREGLVMKELVDDDVADSRLVAS